MGNLYVSTQSSDPATPSHQNGFFGLIMGFVAPFRRFSPTQQAGHRTKRPVYILSLLLALCLAAGTSYGQNSMIGDGFGGRSWYKPVNYSTGSYSAYTVCDPNKQLYAWGNNSWGQLGNGTNTHSTAPVAVSGMTNTKFYTTGYVALAIKNDNTAWVWATGYTTTDPADIADGSGYGYLPTQVLTNVKFGDAGYGTAAFVKNDGTVWVAGNNQCGQYGNGTTGPSQPTSPPVAQQMTGITNAVRVAIAGNQTGTTTVVLLSDGTIMQAGGGGITSRAGAFAITATRSLTPVALAGISNVVDIKASNAAVFALKDNGDVFSWGASPLGYAGSTTYTPTKITFPAGTAPIVAMSAMNDGGHAFFLDENHKVYAIGSNVTGLYGIGTTVGSVTPVLVATGVKDILVAELFSYIIKDDNTLWAAGKTAQAANTGSIWMNLGEASRTLFTQLNPAVAPMNLCIVQPVPCAAGTIAPTLSASTKLIVSPNTTADITGLVSSTVPAGASLVWFTNNTATGTAYATPTAATAGNYYAFYYDATNDCYSPASSKVLVDFDSDGDGILNTIDLDDDNDGILDAVESPGCYYTIAEANVISAITTGLTTATGTTALLFDGVTTSAATNFQFKQTESLRGPIFTITYPTPVKLSSMTIVTTSNLGNGATAILQGSVDGITWINLTVTPVALSTTTNKVITVNQNAADYQYYRIAGQAEASTLPFPIFEITSAVNTDYNPSAHPKASCSPTDTDNDGIANNLDLDSDGDGCADAFEAGATTLATPNYAFTSAVGTNGLANSLETVADNGTINYALTYANATNSSIKNCLDSDGDGIPDITDLDDDNDGILDTVECGSATTVYLESFETTTVNPYDSSPTNQPGVCLNGQLIATSGANGTPKYLFYNSSPAGGCTYLSGDEVWGTRTAVPVIPNKTYQISYYLSAAAPAPPQLETWLNGVKSGSTVTGTTTWTKYTTTWNSGSATSLDLSFRNLTTTSAGNDFNLDEIRVEDISCADTDGDGIANSLDLDSDGDGCPDAIEGGAAFTTANLVSSTMAGGSTNVTLNLPTPVGSTTATIGVPTSAGTGQAIGVSTTSAVNGCIDTDGDGVPDVDDLDDDNDGILDVAECKAYTVYMTHRADASAGTSVPFVVSGATSTSITVNQTLAYNDLTYNGNNWKLLAAGVQPSATGQISVLMNLNAATGTYVFSDAVLITDGTSYTVIDNDATSGTGGYSFTGAWSIQTTAGSYLTDNSYTSAPYAGKTATWSFTGVQPITCDIDGDGIPNQLDLDSDGDGCADAIEGGGPFTTSNLVSSTMAGGSTNVKTNLPTPVGSTTATMGVPTIAGTGQAILYSQNASVNACTDTDGDSVPDIDDLDDDNDGILDTVENQTGIFSTGADQTFVVPCNTTQLTVKLWGAGGGGGNVGAFTNAGGGGGFATATIAVTPGETLTLVVGSGGKTKSSTTAYGGGGAGGLDPFGGILGASGGGRTEIRRGNTSLLIAGGGGGSGGVTYNPNSGPAYGGGGGGLSGLNALATTSQATNGNGKGGTQAAGGAGGVANGVAATYNGVAGSKYQGGAGGPSGTGNAGAGGGGGGGWYGGGGGSGYGTEPSQENAGGGGSGYADATLGSVSLVAGNTGTVANGPGLAANTTDPNYVNGIGNGGAVGADGGNGLISIAELADIDGDGIPNSLDTDSDGDGCPDAFESGMTSNPTQTTMPAPYGTNGLSNSIESADTQTATVINSPNYSYVKYSQYALNCKLNACTDTDGDGIADIYDLDDDNDGILDTVENGCIDRVTNGVFPVTASFTPFTAYTGWSIAGSLSTSPRGVEFIADNNSVSTLTQTVASGVNNTINITGLAWGRYDNTSSATKLEISYNGVLYATLQTPNATSTAPTIVASNGATVNLATLPILTAVSAPATLSSYSTPVNLAITLPTLTATTGALQLKYTSGASSILTNDIGIRAVSFISCSNGDLDGDGIPNYLDLDSDADGCPDAIEGGAAFTPANITPAGALTGTVSSATATYGVPTQAGTGQTIGTSQNAAVLDPNCPPPCSATVAPALSVTSKTNTCPATTIDLSTITATNAPASLSLTWHTGTPATAANRITNVTSLTAGTYYAAFYDAAANCFSGSLVSPVTASTVVCCPNPSVGGTATYTGGVLCNPTNTGTVTILGNTGTVVKWQTSTNGGANWTDIASTSALNTYTFTNAANGQQYRAVVNNSGSCLDANSVPATITTSASVCPCVTPSVGGSAAYTGGVVCNPTNTGTVTLSGQTGTVVRWQTSTNGGANWTDIASTAGLTSYGFTNAANGQQYRAVVNSGGTCLDANSTPVAITTSTAVCPCTTPSVGGVTSFTGNPLCIISNAGTITLSGQTGTVVIWQTSINGGLGWSNIAGTAGQTSYNFVNAANNQQFRAVVNSGGTCSDANSTVITTVTSAAACTVDCSVLPSVIVK